MPLGKLACRAPLGLRGRIGGGEGGSGGVWMEDAVVGAFHASNV